MPYKDKQKQLEHNRAYNKKWYEANREKKQARIKERKIRTLEFLKSLKNNKKCERCTETDPVCLDFHHVDGRTKEFSLGTAINHGYSVKKIQEEATKCILLCANCHRKEHKGSEYSRYQ